MANESTSKRRRRSQGISRKKALARTPTSTLLWAADHELFHQITKRKKTTPAQLLREIVHDWAITIRLSGQAKDTMEMAGPIRKLHQQIIAEELAPVHAALATLLDRLSAEHLPQALPGSIPPASANAHTPVLNGDAQDFALLPLLQRLADELSKNKEELARLRAFAIAHYMLSGQSFSATWATLDFVQRYLVEPAMRFDPARAHESFEAITGAIRVHRDDARKEGLQMVDQMSLEFRYPEDYQMVLIVPEEVQT